MSTSQPGPKPTHSQALEGISGRLRVDVGTTPRSVIEVKDGDVAVRPGGGAADAVVTCDSDATVDAIAAGKLNPIVARLQNRLVVSGNRAFAIDVILGLHGSRLAIDEHGRRR